MFFFCHDDIIQIPVWSWRRWRPISSLSAHRCLETVEHKYLMHPRFKIKTLLPQIMVFGRKCCDHRNYGRRHICAICVCFSVSVLSRPPLPGRSSAPPFRHEPGPELLIQINDLNWIEFHFSTAAFIHKVYSKLVAKASCITSEYCFLHSLVFCTHVVQKTCLAGGIWSNPNTLWV